MSSLLTEIFELRNHCGSRRQSRYKSYLDLFAVELSALVGVTHPYEFNNKSDLDSFLLSTNLFSNGGIGWNAKLESTEYKYRIVSLGSLLSSLIWKPSSFILKTNAPGAWDRFIKDSKRSAGGWLELENYAVGAYPVTSTTWWNCTWWTSTDLHSDALSSATKIGMYSNWVASKTVILRCRTEDIESAKVAHVPTVVDAYLQKVFTPVFETPVPSRGETIDLSTGSPCRGFDEYVFEPVEVHHIQVLPRNIDIHMRTRLGTNCEENDMNLNKLVSYYQTL